VHEVADVAEALTAAGYTVVSAQAEYVPSTTVRLEGDHITQMGKMLEMFEDNDDIQAVWHNWENEDDYE
jgi:transcriptional/translational regulatory protein YebC/TACO1